MTITVPRRTVVHALRASVMSFAERVTTPLMPADYLDAIDPLISGVGLRGRIVAIHPETRDAVTVVIKTGRGWRTHTPGQFVRIGIDVDGVRQWRAYSLTSPTGRRDNCIAITVKAIPDGVVSNYLVRRATVGTVVQLEPPAGDFTLGTEPPAKILFLTAGSGITPVMGMLRNIPDRNPDVVLVHSARTAADVIFGDELREMAAAGRIRLVERHTATDGRLDLAGLDDLVEDLAYRQTWACGPAGLLDALERRWTAAGMADRLNTERFRSTVVAIGEGGTASFTKSATTVVAGGSQSLLDAGEAAGVLMPSGCRMGICFGCVAPLRDGAVRDLRTGEITAAADGVVIQTCVSAAAGACAIEL